MKKKLLIIFMLLSVMLFSDVLKLPNQYNKAAVNLSGWSLNEKDLDLNQDALDDILLIHYKVESTNVVTYYTSYINQGNGTYKKELQIEKIFSSDTFANDFSAFTKDFVSNYFEYKSGKKTGTTVSNTVTPAKKETVKPADKPSTTAKPVTEVVKPVENVEPTTTDYNILESYSDKKPDNMTFNLKYDKNAPKNIDNFVFVKSDVKIRKEPNYQSPIVSTAKFTDKIRTQSCNHTDNKSCKI